MFIMHDQMGKDVARDAVQSKLSQEVLANFNVFIQGMKHVQEVDLDITRATIHVGNSLRKLKEAREQLIKPSLQLCLWRRRRERLAAVRQRVQWVKTLIGAEARVRALLKQRDYVQAVQLCVTTAVEMDSPRARAITVLDCGPRRRLQNMVPAIRKRLDEVRVLGLCSAKVAPRKAEAARVCLSCRRVCSRATTVTAAATVGARGPVLCGRIRFDGAGIPPPRCGHQRLPIGSRQRQRHRGDAGIDRSHQRQPE